MESVSVSAEALDAFLDFLDAEEEVVVLEREVLAEGLAVQSSYETVVVEDGEREVEVTGFATETFTVTPDEPVPVGFIVSGDGRGWHVPASVDHEVVPDVVPLPWDEQEECKYRYVFDDGEVRPAQFAPDPLDRLDEDVAVTHLTLTNPIGVPYEWHGLTDEEEPFYMRYRSGSVSARVGGDYGIDGETVFTAFVGGEFPGTRLEPEEVIRLVDAVEYIDVGVALPDVPDEVLEEQFDAFHEEMDAMNGDVEELMEEIELDVDEKE